MGGRNSSIRRALAVGALLAVAITAQNAAATDMATLRAKAQTVGDQVTSLSERLDHLAEQRQELSGQIEQANQDISAVEYQIVETENAFDAARARFEERAIEIYKSGTGAELEMLLSAQTLTEMETVTQAMSEASAVDEEVLDELLAAKFEAESAQSLLDQRKQRLMAAQAKKDALVSDIESTVAARDQVLAELNDEIEELEAAARIEAKKEADAAVLAEAPGLPAVPGTPKNPTWGTHDPDRLVGTGPAGEIPDMFASTGVTFEGEASWYGPGFEGNTTANGDIFDSRLYTVASKTLPFGTYLYVEFQGKSVVLYLNDRGPYAGDRILDLSHAAAQTLGMGVGWVRATIIVKK